MKIRSTFVSNSSSSSFVVQLWNYRTEDIAKAHNTTRQLLITEEQIDLLTTHGFQPTSCSAEGIMDRAFENKWVKSDGDYLGIFVTCNQDVVMDFLVNYQISFQGYCHYGTEDVFYTAGDPEVVVIENPGKMIALYKSRGTPNMSNIEKYQELYGKRVVHTYTPEDIDEDQTDLCKQLK